ncbi:MAG: universal stress protein [Euryarchaeota archaeon]|nr:universal stress protein [Euryarchaeota archaeon]
MKSIENNPILVATDGSEYSDAAVAHAVKLASSWGKKLIALYVASISAEVSMQTKIWENLREIFMDEGKKALAKAKEYAQKEGVEIETRIVEGVPWEKIIEVAKEEKVDMIVMGSHGHTRIKDFLLGSVAERVIGGTPCPVVIVRKNELKK